MNVEPLNALLERLCSGDAQAASEVFQAYEPYLRMVVRRQLPARLRANLDSTDIVQSIWTDMLKGFRETAWHFADANHLQAFFVKVTRNRIIDQARHYQGTLRHEQALGATEHEQESVAHDPRPSEVAQADDLWQRMLALCPAGHHELLRLKRQGYSLDDIAAKVGLHKSSVRRILYDLARQLTSGGWTVDPRETSPFDNPA
jgi:RNA polymerase sigma factor (sigma-70 family)